MRRVLLLALILGVCAGLPAQAQAPEEGESDDEVLISGIEQSGGYGAPTVAVTSFNGAPAILTGGQGGWIINRQLVIGGGGRGISTRHDHTIDGQSGTLEMGYGGLLLEYIGAPTELVHLGGGALIGAGGAQLVRDLDGDEPYDDGNTLASTSFFASELEGRVEVNVTSFFRLGLSGGYRLILGSDLQGVSDADLGGPFGRLALRFGSF
jgi:hypothetical protein